MKPAPMVLGWKDEAGITHTLLWDDDLVTPMWVTECGLGPIVGGLVRVSPSVADCMGCIGHACNVIKCQRCRDSGALDMYWADFPCPCVAGDIRLFDVLDDKNNITKTVTGAELKETIARWRRH